MGIITGQGCGERLGGYAQCAGGLREYRIARFNYAIADAVNVLLVADGFAEAEYACAVNVQGAELAITEQGHRVVNFYGQYRLLLHI